MPNVKYEQLCAKPDSDNDVLTAPKPRGKWSDIYVQKSLMSLGLILLYFSLSIGLTFYQRWLLQVSIYCFIPTSHCFTLLTMFAQLVGVSAYLLSTQFDAFANLHNNFN